MFEQFLIPAVASLLGGQMANESNQDIASANNAFNAEQADINRNWQAGQAGITRDFNREMQGLQMDFNSRQAQTNRDYQEQMANTQWQRTVMDLNKAGLNPMLAYMKGPNASPQGATATSGMASASTPGGATASSSGNPNMRDILTPAVTTAFGMAEINAKLDKISAETKLLGAQTRTEAGRPSLVAAQTNLHDMHAILAVSSARVAEATTAKLEQEIPKVIAEVANIKADTENKYIQWRVNQSIADLNDVHKKLMEREIPLREAQTRVQNTLATLQTLAIPRAVNESNVQDTWWMKNISPFLPDLLKGSSALSKVR